MPLSGNISSKRVDEVFSRFPKTRKLKLKGNASLKVSRMMLGAFMDRQTWRYGFMHLQSAAALLARSRPLNVGSGYPFYANPNSAAA